MSDSSQSVVPYAPTLGAPRPNLATRSRTRLGLILVAAIFVGFGGWAATAPLASGVVAIGKFTVDSQRKPVQAAETGIVRAIHIRDGDRVSPGELLVTLDRTRPEAELQIVQSAYDQALAEEARLTAEIEGRSGMAPPKAFAGREKETAQIFAGQQELFAKRRDARLGKGEILAQRRTQMESLSAGLNAQIASKKDQVRIVGQELVGLEKLLAEGLTTRQRVYALRREKSRLEGEVGQHHADLARADTARGQAELEIRQLETDQLEGAAAELSEVRTRIVTFGERLTAARLAFDQTEIRSPAEGIVVGLAVHAEGAVVAEGAIVLEVVPEREKLMVEAAIRPQDIDAIAAGQDADVRLTAFNLRTTPVLKGRLDYVSADALATPEGEPYFLARLSLNDGELEKLGSRKVTPGMPAEIIVKSGEQTALAYLLRPLANSFARAWREQ